MNIQNIFVGVSGADLNLTGSGTTVSLNLLCATSGGLVIPLRCNSLGHLIMTSGA